MPDLLGWLGQPGCRTGTGTSAWATGQSLCSNSFVHGFPLDRWSSCVRVWWRGAAGREENTSTRGVIKPLIKFNSLAVYIGLGIAAVGWNAFAKGKSKYDLTKLEGKPRIWTEMVLVYKFFFFFFPNKRLLFFQGCLSSLHFLSSSFISFTVAKAYPGQTILCYQDCSLPCTGMLCSPVLLQEEQREPASGKHSQQLKAEPQIQRGKT